jgi:hypothetical protein
MVLLEKNIGEVLVECGVISRSQLDMAMKLLEPGRKTGEELLGIGIISSDELEAALELLLAEILVGMGYADEIDIFGSSRTRVVLDDQLPIAANTFSGEDLNDFSDF